MTQLIGTGEVPIKAGMIRADNAMPIPVTFVDENGVVTGVCVGGLTKRQELAARFFAAVITSQQYDDDLADDLIESAILWADKFLTATEPKPNG